MSTYSLCNLDLGSAAPAPFDIGPFRLDPADNYAIANTHLSKLGKHSHTIDFDSAKGIVRASNYIPATEGAPEVTCVLSVENEPAAVLVLESPHKGHWDVCQILSFLAGNRVFTVGSERRFFHQKNVQGAVEPAEIPEASAAAWDHLDTIAQPDAKMAFWLILQSQRVPDVEIKGILCGIALESMMRHSDSTAQKKREPKGTDNQLDSTGKKLADLVNNVRKVIDESGLPDATQGRLRSAVGNWGPSSYSEQVVAFLQKLGHLPEPATSEQEERSRFVATLRNQLAHGKDLPLPRWIADEKTKRRHAIWAAGILVPALAEDYLNSVLGLREFNWPTQNAARLADYFRSGLWES